MNTLTVPANETLDEGESERNLLIIDDEREILNALRRQFRRKYNIHLANSAEEGFAVMTEVPVQVIISDQRMPGMNGAEFFQKVKHEFPDAIRLLLTGYADIQAVITAINEGHIFRYITKPWDPVELDTIVREAFERHDLIVQNRRLLGELQAANQQLEQRVRERTAELEAANERLHELNEQKDRFLGVVAHDLRGPIGNIRNAAQLLASDMLEPDEEREFLEIIDRTTGKMLHLVNDLLDMASIESGSLALEIEEVDVPDFVRSVCRMNERLARKKHIQLQTEIAPQVTTACFDPERIEQVLDNLLTNAFKFSHQHTTVRLAAAQQGDELALQVADQGQGIREEEINQLFKPFQKTSARPTDGEDSTGLGLSICKRIVDLHGGRIEVASEYGQGTRFTVWLPITGQPEENTG